MNRTNDALERKLVDHLNARASEAEVQFTVDDVRGAVNPKESTGRPANDAAKTTRRRLPMLVAAAAVVLFVGGGAIWLGSSSSNEVDTTDQIASDEESGSIAGTEDRDGDREGPTDYERTGDLRAEQATELLASMNTYLDKRVDEIIDWSESTEVRTAAAADYPQVADFEGLSVDQIEATFQTQVLDQSGKSSTFLAEQIEALFFDDSSESAVPVYGEVFLTDSNGYVVGATGPTTDFAQSDEFWWTIAWQDGFFFEPFVFDESAGVMAISVAVRVDDEDGQPIGVIKAVIDASVFESFARSIATDGVDVIVTDKGGVIWAHSAYQHRGVGQDASKDAIFTSEEAVSFNIAKDNSEPSGFERFDSTIVGYAKATGSNRVERPKVRTDLYPFVALVIDDTELSSGAAAVDLDPTTAPDSAEYEAFVPDVVGLSSEEARSTLEAAGFSVSTTSEFSLFEPENQVIRQSPDPSQGVIPVTNVEIVVSQEPALVEVPDVAGRELAVANGLLANAGFIDYISQAEPSALIATGVVIGSEPAAGQSVASDQRITVYVSAGPG